jgi:serine/threonine protein kinase
MLLAASESKINKTKRHKQSIVSSIHKEDAKTKMIHFLKEQRVPACDITTIPQEFPYQAAQEKAYLVTIAGHKVFKTTNCRNQDHVKQLLREHKVGQKLKKLYTHEYQSNDIIVGDIQMLVLEQTVILMIVMNKVGISARQWMEKDLTTEDRVSVIEQIDRIHSNFLKLRFLHGDIKPRNILVRLGEKSNVEVSFCDVGLSKFFDSTKLNANVASRGTACYKLSSYVNNVKCHDYVTVSMFQHVITILSIYLGCSISRIWRCNHVKCYALHIFPPPTKTKDSFLMSMMNVTTVRSRQKRSTCDLFGTGCRREGSKARNTRVKLHNDLCNVLSNPNPFRAVLACRNFLQSLHIKDGKWTLHSTKPRKAFN